MGRISIAGLLGFVVVVAFGLAALVGATNGWVGATFTLTTGLLFASLLGVILRGWRGGGWLGFAVFGWGYFLLANIPVLGLYQYQRMLPDIAAEWVFLKSNPRPTLPPPRLVSPNSMPTPAESAYFAAENIHNERFANAGLIAYWLSRVAFAGAGAVLGVFLARGRRAVEAVPAPPVRPDPDGLPETVIQVS